MRLIGSLYMTWTGLLETDPCHNERAQSAKSILVWCSLLNSMVYINKMKTCCASTWSWPGSLWLIWWSSIVPKAHKLTTPPSVSGWVLNWGQSGTSWYLLDPENLPDTVQSRADLTKWLNIATGWAKSTNEMFWYPNCLHREVFWRTVNLKNYALETAWENIGNGYLLMHQPFLLAQLHLRNQTVWETQIQQLSPLGFGPFMGPFLFNSEAESLPYQSSSLSSPIHCNKIW